MILMALDHTRDLSATSRLNPDEPRDDHYRALRHALDHAFLRADVLPADRRGRLPDAPPQDNARGIVVSVHAGGWLIVLEVTVARFFWQFNLDYHVTFLTVLWALGWSMIVLSALVHLPVKCRWRRSRSRSSRCTISRTASRSQRRRDSDC